jgi:hypothetical protein
MGRRGIMTAAILTDRAGSAVPALIRFSSALAGG